MKMAWRFYINVGLAAILIMASGNIVQLVESTVPALFVFGDSLLDTGNSNNLSTLVNATSPPYENYPSGGRFSNGPVTTDFVAAQLDLPSPPPFLTMGSNIKRGVNFASGGSGILDSTGEFEGQHISLRSQIKNFQEVKKKLKVKVGSSNASSIISRAIFLISTGSNDYFNYFTSRNPAYALYSPKGFEDLVISNFTSQLKSLYKLGARKFTVASLPIIGCTPFERELYRNGNGECVSFLQKAAQAYNKRLLTILQKLQARLSESHFLYTNIYESSLQIYQNPTLYDIVNINDACCGGKVNLGLCFEGIPVCADPSHYFFFDGIHPTSLVHNIIANISFTGSAPFVVPYNLKTLASLP